MLLYPCNPERGFLFPRALPTGKTLKSLLGRNFYHGVVGAKPSNMNKFKNRLHSFILLPLLLTNIQAPEFFNKPLISDQMVENLGMNFQNLSNDAVVISLDPRAEKIDAYFAQWDLPMSGYGDELVAVADEYDLPYNLLPALAMLETTGGKNVCKSETGKNNFFGYGSCKIPFATPEDSFRAVAKTISGNSEKTAHLYKGKTVEEILEVYNPPEVEGIMPGYHKKAIRVMTEIDNMEVPATLAQA